MPTSLPAVFLRLESLVVVIAAVALYFHGDYAVWAFLVFFLHIGIDRVLGLGLKYPPAFKDTHLGRI